jgi:hypothetical protein
MDTWVRKECRKRVRRQFFVWILASLFLIATGPLCAVMIPAVIIWRMIMLVVRLKSIEKNRVVKKVKDWGAAQQVEQELNGTGKVAVGEVIILPDYVIKNTFLSFNVFRLDDLVWAYPKRVKHSINLIPTITSFHCVFNFVDGSVDAPLPKQVVDTFFEGLPHRVPWAVFGYTEEIKKAFKNDKKGFIQKTQVQKIRGQPVR